MRVYHVTTGLLSENAYFLVNEKTFEAVVIDPGENYKRIKEAETVYGFKIVAALLTHGHFDHAGVCGKLQAEGVKIYISKIDAPKLSNDDNMASAFGRKFDKITCDYAFLDGETLEIAGIKIKVMLTPGHTDGSACFIVEDMLFTGDTLFYESVGRTDFATGNKEQLVNSVFRLFALEGDYKVFPGHREFTTLSHERKHNLLVDYD